MSPGTGQYQATMLPVWCRCHAEGDIEHVGYPVKGRFGGGAAVEEPFRYGMWERLEPSWEAIRPCGNEAVVRARSEVSRLATSCHPEPIIDRHKG